MDVSYGDRRLPNKFWDDVEPQPSGCWLWTGDEFYKARKGGSTSKRKPWAVAYEKLLETDHPRGKWGSTPTCGVEDCIHPLHRRKKVERQLKGRVIWRINIAPEPVAATREELEARDCWSRSMLACAVLAQVQAQWARDEAEAELERVLGALRGALNPAQLVAA